MLRWLVALSLLLITSVSRGDDPPAAAKEKEPGKAERKTVTLFDGKALGHWKSTNFGGEGEVEIKDGQLILNTGVDLSGITWQKPDELPRTNYEIQLEAMRVDGGDFFCGLTFPVKERYCSLICGGWGGGVCGISSIDGNDASENETTSYREFVTGRWYKFRVRVLDEKIEAWIDGKQIIDVETKGRRLNVRGEVELSQPLGFATWRTTGALRKIELTRLSKQDVEAIHAEAAKKKAAAQ